MEHKSIGPHASIGWHEQFRRPSGRARAAAAACLAAAVSAGCGGAPTSGAAQQPPGQAAGGGAGGAVNSGPAGTPAAPQSPPVDPAAAAAVRADELGVVPVLMYHMLLPNPKGVYDRTPAEFRAELERLAREGYVPVTASAFARGAMDVPAGKSPVVLTFDDSTTNQFTLGPDGEPLPDTAVGILLDVAKRNPGFRPVGTFFVNVDPFAEPGGARTLRWLHDHGFEVANHTLSHEPLRGMPADKVQQEIAGLADMVRKAVPEAPVETFALPLGSMPDRRELALRGLAGGLSYEHRAVFLVGYKPAPSPYDAKFDPNAVPRIRTQSADGDEPAFGSTGWLDQLARKPGMRYVSDGDPARISFPTARAGQLAPAHADRANPY